MVVRAPFNPHSWTWNGVPRRGPIKHRCGDGARRGDSPGLASVLTEGVDEAVGGRLYRWQSGSDGG